MAEFGLRWYDFFLVTNSTWINEMKERRPAGSYDLFENYEHYIITFKDITLDIVSKKFEEVELTNEQIHDLVNLQLNYLNVD
jgi:hypothetical protein